MGIELSLVRRTPWCLGHYDFAQYLYRVAQVDLRPAMKPNFSEVATVYHT